MILPALALAACATRAPAPRVVDLMPDFWRFWELAEGREPARRVALLKEIVIDPHRPFYGEVVSVPDDERLAAYLERIAPAIPELREMSRDFPPLFARAWDQFRRTYPNLDPQLPIYFAPSLFTSNGQVRYLGGRPIVMFGLDVSAYLKHDPTALPALDDPLLSVPHELFHAYHWQVNSEVAEAARSFFTPGTTSPLYFDLWSEGLAALASHRLQPSASLGAVLSSEVLAREAPPLGPRLARELRSRLVSTDADEVRDYFFLSSERTDIPRRSAYYIGYRVAAELASSRTLDELALLQGAELLEAIDRTLQGLALEP